MKKGFIVTLIVIASIVVLIVGISLLTNKLSTNYKEGIYTFNYSSSSSGYFLTVEAGDQTDIEIPTKGHRGYPVKYLSIHSNALKEITIPEGIPNVTIYLGDKIEKIELPSSVSVFDLRCDDEEEYGFSAFEKLETIVYHGSMEAFKKAFREYEKLREGVEIVCLDGTIVVEHQSDETH